MSNQIEKYADVHELVNDKVNTFTDSMVEDIQDIIKAEFPEVKGFTWGVLPPEYAQVKLQLKEIIANYIHENIVRETDERIEQEDFMFF